MIPPRQDRIEIFSGDMENLLGKDSALKRQYFMINHSSAKTYNVVTGQPKEDPYVAAHDNERLKKKIEIECREYNLESTDATELHNIYQNNLHDHRKAQAEWTRKKYEI